MGKKLLNEEKEALNWMLKMAHKYHPRSHSKRLAKLVLIFSINETLRNGRW